MKKSGIFLLVFLIISLLSNIIIDAQGLDESGLPPELGRVEKLRNATEQLTEEETREAYLKQEWVKILEKSKAGRVLLFISDIFKILSPVFKLFTGVEYSLSWLFFLSLGAWIAIVIIIYKPVKKLFQANKWVSFGIAVIVATLGAQFGVIQMIISFFLPLLKNKWIITLSIIIGALLVYFYSSLIDTFGKALKEQTKKEDEERREQKSKTAEKLHDIEIKATGV